jgi:hypothetical protein
LQQTSYLLAKTNDVNNTKGYLKKRKSIAASILMAIAPLVKAASTSETSVNFCRTTRRNVSEDSHLHAVPLTHYTGIA